MFSNSILETIFVGPGVAPPCYHAGRPAVRVALPGSSGVADDVDEDSSSPPTLALQLCGIPLRLQV